MHKYELRTNRDPVCLDIGVQVKRPTKVKITVLDPTKRGCVFLDRWQTVERDANFEARLPQNSEKVLVLISSLSGNDNNVRVTRLKKKKLKQHLPCVSGSRKVKEFIKFAQWFSENATNLRPGTYYSKNKNFRIDYLPSIVDKGRRINTPARISNKTGRMEVSKSHYDHYTVPTRMAILCHEYAHFNMNVVQKDEIEADLNGLKLYLGLGYPVIEAHKSWIHVFKRNDNPQNRERYEYLKTFIDNFDKIKYRICI